MSKPFIINNKEVSLGEQKVITLNVSNLPSGTPIDINIHVYRSNAIGKTILVCGGVHGDEINGVEIVRRAMTMGYFDNLKRGNVIAIPLLNVYGFINFSRDLPDGKDVNRSFPGSEKGSLASRVAAAITKEIFPLIDFGLDFHTGGNSHYNYPQIRYSFGDEQAKILANQFGGLCLIEKKAMKTTMRYSAMEKSKPILVYEGGENLRLDDFSIQEGLKGIQRVLAAHGMIDLCAKNEEKPPLHFHNSKWTRATKAGILHSFKKSGEFIEKGEKIAAINDPYGTQSTVVFADKSAFIIGHENSPVINQGDAIFHLAW